MKFKILLFLFLLSGFKHIPTLANEPSIFDSINENIIQENGKSFKVCIVALNKVTTKSKKLSLYEGESYIFDNLKISLKKSFINKEKKEYAALILVLEQKFDSDPVILFEGWIVTPKQYVSTINHPIYEIFLIECKS